MTEWLKTDYTTGLPITTGYTGHSDKARVDQDCRFYSTSCCNCLSCVNDKILQLDNYGRTPWEASSVSKDTFPNWDLFPRTSARPGDAVSAVTVSMAPLGGSKCKKCHCVNEHAAPNQKDGSYICYCCR